MSTDPLIGQEIDGRLEVLERIGEGGMGVVYRAKHKLLGTTVALKVIHPALAATPEVRSRFLREARAASSVADPRVVAVRDAGEVDGQLYITMELVEGKTLQEVLAARGPLETRRAVAITVQVLRALETAHAKGIIHRDLKPGNVMLEAGDAVKVLDFGLAKWIGPAISGDNASLTMTGHIVGALGYMAPEQITGDPADARTDLYAVCVILYELLSGRRPHAATSGASLLRQIVLEDPEPLDGPVGEVVMSGLAREPADRPASAQELRGLLEGALERLPAAQRTAARTALTTLEPELRSPTGTSGPKARGSDRAAGRRKLTRGLLGLAGAIVAGFLIYLGVGLATSGSEEGEPDKKTTAKHEADAGAEDRGGNEAAGPGTPDAEPKSADSVLAQATAAWELGEFASVTRLLNQAKTAGASPTAMREWTIERSLDNLGQLASKLAKRGARKGGWPRYSGEPFVLALVLDGELNPYDAKQRRLLFSPTDIVRAAATKPVAYGAVTRASLRDYSEKIERLTSYAGRRNGDREHVITSDQMKMGTMILADVSIPGVVLVGYTNGQARRLAYADLDLTQGDFGEELLGDNAAHEGLAKLFGGFMPRDEPPARESRK